MQGALGELRQKRLQDHWREFERSGPYWFSKRYFREVPAR
jgi:hypothetical protein